jgi:hypothetical protein
MPDSITPMHPLRRQNAYSTRSARVRSIDRTNEEQPHLLAEDLTKDIRYSYQVLNLNVNATYPVLQLNCAISSCPLLGARASSAVCNCISMLPRPGRSIDPSQIRNLDILFVTICYFLWFSMLVHPSARFRTRRAQGARNATSERDCRISASHHSLTAPLMRPQEPTGDTTLRLHKCHRMLGSYLSTRSCLI